MRAVTVAKGLIAASAYKLRRGLRQPMKPVEAVASRSWEIAPGGVEQATPIYMPEAHESRVLCGSFGNTDVKALLAAIRQESYEHRPTRAHVLPNACIVGHNVYCGPYKDDLWSVNDRKALLRGDVAELDFAVLASTYSGTRWFGHFLHDELPLQQLVPSLGPGVSHVRRYFKHEPGWRTAMGIEAPPMYAVLRAKELLCVDDKGQHAEKRQRYQAMRAQIPMHGKHRRVLLVRNAAAGGESREIVNAEDVQARLVQEGFHVVDTGRVSVSEMLDECSGAETVVSVEGSHAAPAYYFAQLGACLFYVYPPQRVSVQMPALSMFYGLFGAMFIGEPVAGSDLSFRVDPEELVREIERAEHAARQVRA